MGRVLFCPIVLLVIACAGAAAQTGPYTPRPGSAERRAIMDTLRPRVERDLGQKVVFEVSRLRVQDGWAFMIVTPRRPDGSPIDFSRTRFGRWYEAGSFSDLAIALLRRRGGRWRVVEYALGPTDVVYLDWARRHGAPRALFEPERGAGGG